MTNDYKTLRKSATLRTTLTFVVAISPFIVHLIYFCISTHKVDYIASTTLCSVVTLVLVWKYISYYLVFWCTLHQNHASIKECVVQSVEKCSEELSKECSEDIKFPLTSVCIDIVKRMYFISILLFAINLAPLSNIKFPEANDTGVLLVTCFFVVLAVFSANIQRDIVLKSLPELINENANNTQKFCDNSTK